jgi:hypothetical protein
VITPTADAFGALARSSPWRWSTLRFTASGLPDAGFPTVRAWLRRPDRLRVETMNGQLRQIVRHAGPAVAVLSADGGRPVSVAWGGALEPVLRPDGLVDRRPADRWCYDAPMYQNYRWVAMLDPVELADGIDRETGATVAPLTVHDVREVEHAGRPAWEAVLTPTPAYEPRCGCCSLLRSLEVDVQEYGPRSEHVLDEYPEAHRVRLDVGTGVCVLTEQLGGATPGQGHDVRIEAVDEPVDDDLFVEPRRVSFPAVNSPARPGRQHPAGP